MWERMANCEVQSLAVTWLKLLCLHIASVLVLTRCFLGWQGSPPLLTFWLQARTRTWGPGSTALICAISGSASQPSRGRVNQSSLAPWTWTCSDTEEGHTKPPFDFRPKLHPLTEFTRSYWGCCRLPILSRSPCSKGLSVLIFVSYLWLCSVVESQEVVEESPTFPMYSFSPW